MVKKVQNTQRTIGIIGGMGPQASSLLYNLLVQKAISDYSARNDEDFPDIVLFSVAVPNFITKSRNMKPALKILKEKVIKANEAGVTCMSIACNTAHILVPELEKVSRVPFISLINEVSEKVRSEGIREVGILGSPTTIQTGLYQKALEAKGICAISPEPEQLESLESIITNVISGNNDEGDVMSLISIANSLKKKGAKGIILGCTELPLVFPQSFVLPIFNSVD